MVCFSDLALAREYTFSESYRTCLTCKSSSLKCGQRSAPCRPQPSSVSPLPGLCIPRLPFLPLPFSLTPHTAVLRLKGLSRFICKMFLAFTCASWASDRVEAFRDVLLHWPFSLLLSSCNCAGFTGPTALDLGLICLSPPLFSRRQDWLPHMLAPFAFGM